MEYKTLKVLHMHTSFFFLTITPKTIFWIYSTFLHRLSVQLIFQILSGYGEV